MEFDDFSDLSSFIYGEYDKLSDSFGLNALPEKSIKFVEKSIREYTKLYKKPLFEREKRELELRTAFETMPHNWIWKMFHSRLWAKMKKIMKDQKETDKKPEKGSEKPPEQKPDILVPAVIVQKQVANIEPIQEESEFDSDFG